ncbi:hypothetical protein ES703_35580 [subsurface metagenome]
MIHCTYNDRFLPIEDTRWSDYWRFRPVVAFYKLASEYDDGYAQWLASRAETVVFDGNPGIPIPFLYLWKNPNIAIIPPTDLPLTRYFSGIGNVFHRTGWTDSDYVLLFKSGSSRGHAHADQNSWSLFGPSGVGVISGNPGYLFSAADNQTKNSNCMLGDGLGQAQEPGDFASAPLGTKGVVEQVDIQAGYMYMRGDAHAPYLGLSNPEPALASGDLTKFKRHLIVSRNPFYFVIFDDVAAPKAEQLDWLFQGNGGSFTINGDVITLNHGVKLNAVVVEPSPFVYQLNPDTNYPPQMWIHPVANTSAAKFLVALFPGTALPTEGVREGNLIGVIVTDGIYKNLVLFSSDGNPVNEYLELGGYYSSDDGQVYQMDGTRVRAEFFTYQVMRLKRVDAIQVSLTISAGVGGSTDPSPGAWNYNMGSSIIVTALPDAGYQFVEWQENGIALSMDNPLSLTMDVDRHLTAVFKEIIVPPQQYALTISVLGEGTTEPAPGPYTIPQGQSITIVATPQPGYRFDHWEGDIAGTAGEATFIVNSNMSVVAVFVEAEVVVPLFAAGAAGAAVLTLLAILGTLIARRRE